MTGEQAGGSSAGVRDAAGSQPDKITRLQLGVSRFERLQRRALAFFSDGSWLHYGTAGTFVAPRHPLARALRERKQRFKQQAPLDEVEAAYASTNFAPWVFAKGDALEFLDDSLTFIYAEHFFEHLFFDEAVALLRECRRVLQPDGVIRIVVPDADLRTYERPEAVGFPKLSMRFNDPKKHKTRWSVYMLAETLELVGFSARPVVFCTKAGAFISEPVSEGHPFYRGCVDPLIFTLDYVQRPKSLIVDGRKAAG